MIELLAVHILYKWPEHGAHSYDYVITGKPLQSCALGNLEIELYQLRVLFCWNIVADQY